MSAEQHLSDLQAKAMQVQYLLAAADALGNDLPDTRQEITTAALNIAASLNAGLDAVSLPKLRAV